MKKTEGNMKKSNLRRGVTVVELIIVIAIIGILSSYTVVKFKGANYKNASDSDRLKIMTKVNNTNIEARFKSEPPKYIKFQDNGIVVIDSLGNLEVDKGFNTKKLTEKGISISFDCGEDKPVIKDCPLVIFEGGKVNQNISGAPFPLPNPSDLGNESYRESNGYIQFSDGNPDKSFTVYNFDENGIAKSGVVFIKRADFPMRMEPYRYVGAKNNIIWKNDNMKVGAPPSIKQGSYSGEAIDSNWVFDELKTGAIKIEIR